MSIVTKLAVCVVGAGVMACAAAPASAQNVRVLPHTSTAGAPVAWTIIGVAGTLGVYDIIRRTTCAGDFARLGGPGFDRAMRPTDNAIPPRNCTTTRRRGVRVVPVVVPAAPIVVKY